MPLGDILSEGVLWWSLCTLYILVCRAELPWRFRYLLLSPLSVERYLIPFVC